MPAASVAGQGSELKCLCSELICHSRGFPPVRVVWVARLEGERHFFVYLTHCSPVCLHVYYCEENRKFIKAVVQLLVPPPHQLKEF